MEIPRTQPVEFREIRTVPETLNATFDFIREHARPLGKLILQRALPPLILAYIIYANFLSATLVGIFNPYAYNMEGAMAFGSPALQFSLMIVLFAIGYTLLIASVHAYARRVEEGNGEEVELSEVWKDVKADFWMVFWTNIGVGILYLITVALISAITGLFSVVSPLIGAFVQLFLLLALITTFSLYYPARLLDREGFGSAFTRSSSLVATSWWKTMGLMVLCLLLLLSLSLVALLPVYIVLWMIGENRGDLMWMEQAMPIIEIVFTLGLALYACLLQIFGIIPLYSLIFHYYNQIERRESWGLNEQIEQIGVVDAEA